VPHARREAHILRADVSLEKISPGVDLALKGISSIVELRVTSFDSATEGTRGRLLSRVNFNTSRPKHISGRRGVRVRYIALVFW
jgi:hypothetical protein